MAMSLRIVAGETSRLCRSTRAFDPTGSLVETKSSTMARSTASFLSSSTYPPPLALRTPECQVYGGTILGHPIASHRARTTHLPARVTVKPAALKAGSMRGYDPGRSEGSGLFDR